MESTALFILILATVIVFGLVQIYIIRRVLKVDQQVQNQKAIVWLLLNLCEKSGVRDEVLEDIKKVARL